MALDRSRSCWELWTGGQMVADERAGCSNNAERGVREGGVLSYA